jgi:hypothetical protein
MKQDNQVKFRNIKEIPENSLPHQLFPDSGAALFSLFAYLQQ